MPRRSIPREEIEKMIELRRPDIAEKVGRSTGSVHKYVKDVEEETEVSLSEEEQESLPEPRKTQLYEIKAELEIAKKNTLLLEEKKKQAILLEYRLVKVVELNYLHNHLNELCINYDVTGTGKGQKILRYVMSKVKEIRERSLESI